MGVSGSPPGWPRSSSCSGPCRSVFVIVTRDAGAYGLGALIPALIVCCAIVGIGIVGWAVDRRSDMAPDAAIPEDRRGACCVQRGDRVPRARRRRTAWGRFAAIRDLAAHGRRCLTPCTCCGPRRRSVGTASRARVRRGLGAAGCGRRLQRLDRDGGGCGLAGSQLRSRTARGRSRSARRARAISRSGSVPDPAATAE